MIFVILFFTIFGTMFAPQSEALGGNFLRKTGVGRGSDFRSDFREMFPWIFKVFRVCYKEFSGEVCRVMRKGGPLHFTAPADENRGRVL